MMKPRFCLQRCRRLLQALCVSVVLCALAAPALPGRALAGEGERAKAVIIAKGPDCVLLDMHGFKKLESNRLALRYNPMIYDVDGTALTLKNLRVPCQAWVEYKTDKGSNEPWLFRLEVTSYNPEASSRFTVKKQPEKLPE